MTDPILILTYGTALKLAMIFTVRSLRPIFQTQYATVTSIASGERVLETQEFHGKRITDSLRVVASLDEVEHRTGIKRALVEVEKCLC